MHALQGYFTLCKLWLSRLTSYAGLGHSVRACPEDKIEEIEQVVIKCVNCDEVGHRARDCKIPRKDKFSCRNCG